MKNTYKMFLNVLLILIVLVAVGILSYMAYDYISNYIVTKEAEEAVNLFQAEVNKNSDPIIVDIGNAENTQGSEIVNNIVNETTTNTTNIATTTAKYKNYTIIGSIEIPKIKIKYPVVENLNALSIAVVAIYGPGLNQVRKYRICSTQLQKWYVFFKQ